MQETAARGCALGHVVLNVTSLGRSVPFYVGVLGLRVVGRTNFADRSGVGDIVFLSFGANHHDVGLREMPPDGEATRSVGLPTGLSHVAFRCGHSLADLEQIVRRLVDVNAAGIRAVDHGATKSVYFNDPDDLVLEAYIGDDRLLEDCLSIVATPLQIDFASCRIDTSWP